MGSVHDSRIGSLIRWRYRGGFWLPLLTAIFLAHSVSAVEPELEVDRPLANGVDQMAQGNFDDALHWFDLTLSDFPGSPQSLQARYMRVSILVAREAADLLLSNAWYYGAEAAISDEFRFANRSKSDFEAQMRAYHEARVLTIDTLIEDTRRLLVEDDGRNLLITVELPSARLMEDGHLDLDARLRAGIYLEPRHAIELQRRTIASTHRAYLGGLFGLPDGALAAGRISGPLDRVGFLSSVLDRLNVVVQERSTDADCLVITAELARRILALVGDDPYSVVGSRARTVLTTLGFTPSLPDTEDAEAEPATSPADDTPAQ